MSDDAAQAVKLANVDTYAEAYTNARSVERFTLSQCRLFDVDTYAEPYTFRKKI